MPVPKSTLSLDGHARIQPHTDIGFCTILFQDEIGGLEVDPLHSVVFVPATPMAGTCVINVADLLQRLSNGKLRSTRHRVTTPQLSKEELARIGDDGMLPTRYSTAFFVHPSADTIITSIIQAGEEESKYGPVQGSGGHR
jgi:isopenicillin N synthase-like dioxygenase